MAGASPPPYLHKSSCCSVGVCSSSCISARAPSSSTITCRQQQEQQQEQQRRQQQQRRTVSYVGQRVVDHHWALLTTHPMLCTMLSPTPSHTLPPEYRLSPLAQQGLLSKAAFQANHILYTMTAMKGSSRSAANARCSKHDMLLVAARP